MKTKTVLLILGGVAVAWYVYKKATVTLSSDVRAVSSILNLPKVYTISDLLKKTDTTEPQVLRASVSLFG